MVEHPSKTLTSKEKATTTTTTTTSVAHGTSACHLTLIQKTGHQSNPMRITEKGDVIACMWIYSHNPT